MEFIKFSATWCQPCRIMKPIVDKVFNDTNYSNINITTIDIDEDEDDLSGKYRIRSVPTLLALDDDNQVIDRISGAVSENRLRQFVELCTKKGS